MIYREPGAAMEAPNGALRGSGGADKSSESCAGNEAGNSSSSLLRESRRWEKLHRHPVEALCRRSRVRPALTATASCRPSCLF